MGLLSTFQKLKEGLSKTREGLLKRVEKAITFSKKIDQTTIDAIEEILLSSDIGSEITEQFIKMLHEESKGKDLQSTAELHQLLKSIMRSAIQPIDITPLNTSEKPSIIMIVGVNGAGKTTTIGKLSYIFRSRGKKVLVGAADTFRAAANEQIAVWASRADVEIIQQAQGADPAAVAFDTVQAGIARDADIILLDTAGRLHTKSNLMEELRKIHRIVGKKLPGAPHEVLLVLDANTGQNAIQQALLFKEATHVTGLIVTKLDGTAKGGVIFRIWRELKIPIRFIGVGEHIDDLQEFDPQLFLDALFEEKKPDAI